MITIKSYIFSHKNTTKRFLVNNALPKTLHKDDLCAEVVQGAVEIFYNGRSLLNIDDFWGLIDTSWSMIVGMIFEFLEHKIGYSEIVECGARFEIMWVGDNRCAFTITSYETETIIMPTDALLKVFVDAADLFFTTTKAIFGEAYEYNDMLDVLSELKAIIYHKPQSEWWSLIIRPYIHNPDMYPAQWSDFKPYVRDKHWIYTRNKDVIWALKNQVSRDELVGLIYLEYKDKSLITRMAPGRIDQFAISCMMMIMDFFSGASSVSLAYEDITIVLEKKTHALVSVRIAGDGNTIEYIAQGKMILGSLLSTSANILGTMKNADYDKITIAHYSNPSECMRELREQINHLPG